MLAQPGGRKWSVFTKRAVDGWDGAVVIRLGGNAKKRKKNLSASTTMAQNAGHLNELEAGA
jgi:hypothetical protein